MINLLPAEYKQQIRAARTNVLLRRYLILSFIAAGFLAVALAGAYFVMVTAKDSAAATLTANQQKASSFSAVEQQADSFRSDLSTAKTILDNQIYYSKAILAIAHALPPNIILGNLDLDVSTFGTPVSLSAKAKSYNDALTLKDTLQASNVFSNVRLESVSSGSGDTKGYPIDIKINVTIKKEITK